MLRQCRPSEHGKEGRSGEYPELRHVFLPLGSYVAYIITLAQAATQRQRREFRILSCAAAFVVATRNTFHLTRTTRIDFYSILPLYRLKWLSRPRKREPQHQVSRIRPVRSPT